ncbi:TonB-dependent receptor, plug [sediment metagenome]|uniref:TonB-dependent receptor, plug n=1 Tax=sediment metagenome TaxID=749907 RepID=D9PMS4_9ZZZZ
MWALVLGAALACPHAVQAAVTEADFLDEMPVVLSVSRLSQPVNEAPAAVTVIDQDMIRASGFRDIPDLLRLVPGFSVAYTRTNTWAVGYHGLADAYSRRFQVLVDGRSIYSAAFGAVQWQELPLSIDDVERIEVVRGPNAATFGSNAFFAVINIITKEAVQVPGTFASVQYGDHGMAGLTLRHGGKSGDTNYRLTFSAQNRDRFDEDTYDNIPPIPLKLFEETRTYMVNGRADHRVSASDEVSAQFGLAIGDWQAGRQLDPPNPEHVLEPRQQDVNNAYVQLKFRRVLSVDDEWSLQFYHSRHDFEALSSLDAFGLTIIGDQDALQTRTSLEFQANSRLAPDLRMAWGAEVRRETVESPLYFDSSDTLDGVLGRVNANLEWRVRPDLLLQGGAMLEYHYYAGLDVSPRVAMNYDFAPGHTLRLNVSQAYRMPTFQEQDGNIVYRSTTGLPIDIITVPTSNLQSERIRSHEIGYVGQYRPWRIQLDAKLFYDKVDDYIGSTRIALPVGAELVSGGSPGRARQGLNSGSFTLRGGDLQLNWQPTHAFRLSAQYARVYISTSDALDTVDDDVKDSVPLDNFSLLARYDLGQGWMVSTGVYHSSSMDWLDQGDSMEPFTRVDARLARRWTWQGHEVEAAVVGQALNGDYSEFRESQVFSRRVYGSLSLAW